MAEQQVRASDFKARCLAILDSVAAGGPDVVVTKHGVPVARVVPVSAPASVLGSVTLLVDDDEAYFAAGEGWHADG